MKTVDAKRIQNVGRECHFEDELIARPEGRECFRFPSRRDCLVSEQCIKLPQRPRGFAVWFTPELISDESISCNLHMKQSELAVSITTNIVYKICIVATAGRCLQIARIKSELVKRYPPD